MRNVTSYIKVSGIISTCIVTVICVFISIVIFLIGINDSKAHEHWINNEAVITEIVTRSSDEHDVYVDHVVNEETYKHISLGYYSSTMRENDKVGILYNPNNPNEICSSDINSSFFSMMGSIFLTIGALIPITYIFVNTYRNQRIH